MLATAPTPLANPCTAPCALRSAAPERIARSEGHITPLPTASGAVPR